MSEGGLMKRFSIAWLMVVVLLIAADFAIVRGLWGFSGFGVAIAIFTLPMINLLLLAFGRVKEKGETGLYWLGFEVGGWCMVMLVAFCTSIAPDLVVSPVTWVDDHDGITSTNPAETIFLISFAVVLYTTPQLL